jgi:MoaA/NifB/PqqE/SkfB family radical SAM enzyme
VTTGGPATTSVFDGRVPYPEFASIETTMKCNLQCPMCLPFLEGSTVMGRHMGIEEFEPIARAVFPYVDWFQLTISGEPLMSKGLDRMLALAAEYGVRAEYYTNGTLLNDRMVAMILPTLGEVCVSFDGATTETFDVLRAGATFERVLENVERLGAAVRAVPERERPVIGLAVTIMERNVRELPALVELAHRIGLDFVVAAHVFPVIPEFQRQSLARHSEVAREWIGKALARAEELGMPLHVQALDQVIVAMARSDRPSGTTERPIALEDGVVAGLGMRAVNQARRRPRPGPPVATAEARRHVAARRELRGRADVLGAEAAAAGTELPESVWYCDFLWNRIYVTAEGTVRPCCVPGVPDIAEFKGGDLAAVWDDEAYRAMRIGLVRKEPVPVCKGCQHIQEARDPGHVARLLQGRALPPPHPLPRVLRPAVPAPVMAVDGTRDRPRVLASAPALTWPSHPGAEGYAFEAVTESDGKRLRYDTAQRGIALAEPRFEVPEWLWNLTPVGTPAEWRALAELPRERVVVARGCLVRSA